MRNYNNLLAGLVAAGAVALAPNSSIAEVYPLPVPQSIVGKVLCEEPAMDPNRTINKDKDRPAIYLDTNGTAMGFHPVMGYHMPPSLGKGAIGIWTYNKEKQRTYYFEIVDINQDGKSDSVKKSSYVANYQDSGRAGDVDTSNFYRGQLHQDEMAGISDWMHKVRIPPTSKRQIPENEVGSMEWEYAQGGTKISPNYRSLEDTLYIKKFRSLFAIADKIIAKLPRRFSKDKFFSPKDCNTQVDNESLSSLVKELVDNEKRW